jgi:tRNA A-37 threonylcarbamoyl transferase component Bud32
MKSSRAGGTARVEASLARGTARNDGGTLGRYEFKEQLAVGGMGVIHRAYDRWTQRQVAYKQLKVDNPDQRPRMTALFQREYDTLARLSHPNIVEVYDYGEDAHGPYYAMELLSGSDLSQLAPLPWRETCRIVRDIASALALIHARKLVHRDVSPNNVRLTSEQRAKLIDFGGLTPFGRPRELIGTPTFVPPECLERGELDQRSDLYSLGAVAYWALTRRVPLKARSFDELFSAWKEPIRPPSEHVAQLPPELDKLVLSMLARDPLSRPTSAAHVIDRLTAIAELEPEQDERRVAYSYLAHPSLCGRSEVLESLQRVLALSMRGNSQVVVVEGRAGLGRTAVLDHAARLAQVSGATLLRAQGELSAAPFSIARRLTDAAHALFPQLEASAERGSQHIPVAATRARPARTAVEVAEHHAAMVAAATQVLVRTAEISPLVIVIDDLQGCDPESLAVIAALADSEKQANLTLIVSTLTGHPRANDPAHRKVLERAVRLTLTALDPGHMVELVHALFGGVPNSHRLAQWLFTQTGGVPGSVIDLARVLLQRGAVRYTHGTFALPHDIDTDLSSIDLTNATLARLSDLPGDARRLTELFALHEGPLTPDQLAHAGVVHLRATLLCLEELTSRGIVMETSEGFALPAETLRAAIVEGLGVPQQRALHERLARALLAHPGHDPESRLHATMHLIKGGCEDEAAELIQPELALLTSAADMSGVAAIGVRWVPLLEALLAIYRKQQRSKEQRLKLMVPLVLVGFYGALSAQRRHIDEALEAMSELSGMTLATKLRPYFGGMLALIIGTLYASLRWVFTPKRERVCPKPSDMVNELVSMVSSGCAAAASAFDAEAAARYVRWLEPLSALPKSSAGHLLREFCVAVAETIAGQQSAASSRYARLITCFSKPVRGVDERLRQSLYLGALNGRAQAEVSNPEGKVLELADELSRGAPFFTPHAESARMTYYALRGEHKSAALHRERAEMLALRGGVSWSAVTVMTVRFMYAAAFTHDVIGLVQVTAELDRLSAIAPKLSFYRRFAEAWIEHLRGRTAQAAQLLEQLHAEEGEPPVSRQVNRTFYAAVLNELGRHEEARAICKLVVQESPRGEQDASWPLAQLAFAEQGLGHREVALALIARHVSNAEQSNNPLWLGSAHRDAALLALTHMDFAAFEHHFAAMQQLFRQTENPSLIQQCDAVLDRAVQVGARAKLHAPVVPTLEQAFDERDAETMMETTEAQPPTALDVTRQAVKAEAG